MSNLAKRIISAAVLLPPVISLVVWGSPWMFGLFIIVLSGLAGFEFGTITFGKTFPERRVFVGLLSALVCSSLAVYGQGEFFVSLGLTKYFAIISHAPFAALFLIVPLSFLAFMFTSKEPPEAVNAAIYSAAGAAYTGGLFGVIALIFSLGDDGRWWVLLLAAGTFMGDTLAYTFGRLLGKRKLSPRLSPKKTWAGAFGGLLGAMLSVLAAKLTLLDQLAWYDIIALGLPLSVFCQVGDLAESFLKRGFGIKDSGNIIPGHGGILDRCDALMFGAPVVLFFSLLR